MSLVERKLAFTNVLSSADTDKQSRMERLKQLEAMRREADARRQALTTNDEGSESRASTRSRPTVTRIRRETRRPTKASEGQEDDNSNRQTDNDLRNQSLAESIQSVFNNRTKNVDSKPSDQSVGGARQKTFFRKSNIKIDENDNTLGTNGHMFGSNVITTVPEHALLDVEPVDEGYSLDTNTDTSPSGRNRNDSYEEEDLEEFKNKLLLGTQHKPQQNGDSNLRSTIPNYPNLLNTEKLSINRVTASDTLIDTSPAPAYTFSTSREPLNFSTPPIRENYSLDESASVPRRSYRDRARSHKDETDADNIRGPSLRDITRRRHTFHYNNHDNKADEPVQNIAQTAQSKLDEIFSKRKERIEDRTKFFEDLRNRKTAEIQRRSVSMDTIDVSPSLNPFTTTERFSSIQNNESMSPTLTTGTSPQTPSVMTLESLKHYKQTLRDWSSHRSGSDSKQLDTFPSRVVPQALDDGSRSFLTMESNNDDEQDDEEDDDSQEEVEGEEEDEDVDDEGQFDDRSKEEPGVLDSNTEHKQNRLSQGQEIIERPDNVQNTSEHVNKQLIKNIPDNTPLSTSKSKNYDQRIEELKNRISASVHSKPASYVSSTADRLREKYGLTQQPMAITKQENEFKHASREELVNTCLYGSSNGIDNILKVTSNIEVEKSSPPSIMNGLDSNLTAKNTIQIEKSTTHRKSNGLDTKPKPKVENIKVMDKSPTSHSRKGLANDSKSPKTKELQKYTTGSILFTDKLKTLDMKSSVSKSSGVDMCTQTDNICICTKNHSECDRHSNKPRQNDFSVQVNITTSRLLDSPRSVSVRNSPKKVWGQGKSSQNSKQPTNQKSLESKQKPAESKQLTSKTSANKPSRKIMETNVDSGETVDIIVIDDKKGFHDKQLDAGNNITETIRDIGTPIGEIKELNNTASESDVSLQTKTSKPDVPKLNLDFCASPRQPLTRGKSVNSSATPKRVAKRQPTEKSEQLFSPSTTPRRVSKRSKPNTPGRKESSLTDRQETSTPNRQLFSPTPSVESVKSVTRSKSVLDSKPKGKSLGVDKSLSTSQESDLSELSVSSVVDTTPSWARPTLSNMRKARNSPHPLSLTPRRKSQPSLNTALSPSASSPEGRNSQPNLNLVLSPYTPKSETGKFFPRTSKSAPASGHVTPKDTSPENDKKSKDREIKRSNIVDKTIQDAERLARTLNKVCSQRPDMSQKSARTKHDSGGRVVSPSNKPQTERARKGTFTLSDAGKRKSKQKSKSEQPKSPKSPRRKNLSKASSDNDSPRSLPSYEPTFGEDIDTILAPETSVELVTVMTSPGPQNISIVYVQDDSDLDREDDEVFEINSKVENGVKLSKENGVKVDNNNMNFMRNTSSSSQRSKPKNK